MARTTVRVVRAESDDLGTLEQLWVESRIATGQTRDWAGRMVRDGRVRSAVEHPDVRIFLAFNGTEPAGFLVLARSPLGAMTDEPSVLIDQMYVQPDLRRRGVARALLAVVPLAAESIGVGVITAAVPAPQRGLNRFFARLGFASTTTLRSTSVATLRRHLEPELAAERAGGQSVVRLRRSIRGRARTRHAAAGEAG